jgi:hypothetical protein
VVYAEYNIVMREKSKTCLAYKNNYLFAYLPVYLLFSYFVVTYSEKSVGVEVLGLYT